MRPFDWNDVRYFLAVVRGRTLTLAAQRLGATHSTVARRIAALEQALNARLFDRRSGNYELTEGGERFLAQAEAMEGAAIAAQNSIADADMAVSGAVRIGAPDGFGTWFLAPRIMGLCDRHPDLEVQIIAIPRLFSLSKREADVAISLDRPVEARLLVRKLTDYELGVYARADYLDRHPPIHSRSDLAGHRFINYIDDLIYTSELDYVPQIDKSIRPQIKSANLVAQLLATLAGAGLCVLPCFMVDPAGPLQRVLVDDVRLIRNFWLVIHDDQRNIARIRTTTEFIADLVASHRGLFLPRR